MKTFETPLVVAADSDRRCFEVYDKNEDCVATGIPSLSQARIFAAAPDMLRELKFVCQNCESPICELCGVGKALRKAGIEPEPNPLKNSLKKSNAKVNQENHSLYKNIETALEFGDAVRKDLKKGNRTCQDAKTAKT